MVWIHTQGINLILTPRHPVLNVINFLLKRNYSVWNTCKKNIKLHGKKLLDHCSKYKPGSANHTIDNDNIDTSYSFEGHQEYRKKKIFVRLELEELEITNQGIDFNEKNLCNSNFNQSV